VTAIGELLIDFVPARIGNDAGFLPKPGGAPANVAVAVSRLGGSSAFIGKVGQDRFGSFLKGVLDSERVNVSGLISDASALTTLAFVHLDEKGDRSFSFYRKHCADTKLQWDEMDISLVLESKIVHFGSVSLTDHPAKEAVLYAAEYARKHGVLVSYDPNYRPLLWDSEDAAISAIQAGLGFADIIKVSGEEMRMFTGKDDVAEGTKILAEYGATLIVVTLGEAGAFFRCGQIAAAVPTIKVDVVDTNGAGDAFFGGLLYQLTRSENPLEQSEMRIWEAVRFANVAGALTITKYGSIPAIPTLDEVLLFI
jgi:fructokinase